jgi:hypothetical protein
MGALGRVAVLVLVLVLVCVRLAVVVNVGVGLGVGALVKGRAGSIRPASLGSRPAPGRANKTIII